MKICYVSNNFEIHDYRFLVKLVENNYDVHAVSFRKNKIPNEYFVDKVKYYKYYEIQTFLTKRYKGLNPFWYYNALKFLKKIIVDVKPDILHGGYTSISGFISALSDFHPFLLMPWGSDILINKKISFAKRLLISYSVKSSDLITCDAETVRKKLVNDFSYKNENIITIPWGIDLTIFNPYNNKIPNELLEWKDNFVIICTRQHRRVYGIEYLIEAIPLILKENDNIKFLFIGDGPLTPSYIKMVKRLRCEKYVKFIGKKPNEKLPQYLNNSDIYISPSLSDGSSLCLMESLACGLPSVVTNIKSNLEWVQNNYNGFTCRTKSPREIADNILKLENNEKRLLIMKSNAIKIAKRKADWDKNFLKLEIIYQNLLKT